MRLVKLLAKESINQTNRVKKDPPIDFKQVQCTLVNGKEALEMDLVSKHGQMVLNMSVNGEIIELMERANSFMLMVMFMKDSGQMIKLMVLVLIVMSMERCMKVSGRTIYNMEKG
jgi:hypothetical protein